MNELIQTNHARDILRAHFPNKNTLAAYQKDWQLFAKCIGKQAADVQLQDVQRYVDYLREQYPSNYSRARKFYSVSKLFGLLKQEGLLQIDVFAQYRFQLNGQKLFPVGEKAVLELTKEDIDTVLQHCGPKTAVLIELLVSTGLRISEALAIKHSDIVLQGDYAKARIIGKGNKQRDVYFPSPLYEKIKGMYNSETYLLGNGRPLSRQNVYKLISEVFKKRTGKRIGCHSFRHYYATQQGDKVNLISLSRYLGHSSTQTTARYLHSTMKPEQAILRL